jgi:hypothetical protein
MGIRLKGQTSGYVEIKAPATAADNTLTFPNGNGSNNQVLTTDGSGGLTFAAPQLSTDTTPQLGGDLDVNGNDIITTSNGDIDLDPNGSGQVVFKGNATRGSGAVKLNCENNSHGILVKGPPHSAGANYTLTLPNDTGTSGQLLTTNGSGVTSWSTVNASPTLEATADGAISNGDPCVVLANGDVAKVGFTGTPITQNVGTKVDFDPGDPIYVSAVSVGNNSVALGYADDSDSGTTLTNQVNTFVINDGNLDSLKVVYDATAGKHVLAYRDRASSNRATCQVITVGSSSVTGGGNFNITTSDVASGSIAIGYDSNAGKVVISYGDTNSSPANKGTAVVGTTSTSANSITYGTPVVYETGAVTAHQSIGYDATAQKLILAYRDNDNSNRGTAIVGTVSGTSISFGTAAVFETGSTGNTNVVYDVNAKKNIIQYTDFGNASRGTLVEATISGTSLTFSTPSVFESNSTSDLAMAYEPGQQRIVMAYQDSADNDGVSFVLRVAHTPTNLTTENYIGIADAAYANDATATIQIIGAVDDAQSSLTPGQSYFVQQDGTLATTAGNPSVFAGTAVSATKLIVKG